MPNPVPAPDQYTQDSPVVADGDADPTAVAGSGDTANRTSESATAPESTSPALSSDAARYELGAEIARGGMGAVLRATDIVLRREVAVKVLQDKYAPESGTARRFFDEARITAHLQHPAIPPVHDLGTLPDGRPFLAMKLIRGHTLEKLLKHRADLTADRGRFVAAFEQICHAVGYAHRQGVIHRDLKPANVMVGDHNEVQVMDWGLAKWVADGSANTGTDSTATAETATVGGTTADADTGASGSADTGRRVRTATDTQAGSVLGTPAFMPPEQAIGDIEHIDRRSDVFGLGGILAAILTGKPPFVALSSDATWRMAASGDLVPCFFRLDSCGADAGLIDLCKRCLAPNRDDRPADGVAVADAVAAWRQAADERARQAELDRVKAEGDRAAAELKADGLRRRARLRLALVAAVGLLVAGGGAFAWWQAEAKAEKADLQAKQEAADIDLRNKAAAAREQATRLLPLAADLRAQFRYTEAETALTQAHDAATSGAADLLPAVEQAQRDLAFVRELDAIRAKRLIWIVEPGGKGRFDYASAPPAYRKAFDSWGLEPTTDTAAVGAAVAASAVRADVVAALDDWFLLEPDSKTRSAIVAVLRVADPDSGATPFREPAVTSSAAELARRAEQVDPARLSAGAVVAIAGRMARRGIVTTAFLWAAFQHHRGDFHLAAMLGIVAPTGSVEALAGLRTALTLRPGHVPILNLLAVAHGSLKDVKGAIALFEEAIALDAKTGGGNAGYLHANLAIALAANDQLDAAIAACQKAADLDTKDAWVRFNLGYFWFRKGDPARAVRELEASVGLDAANPLAWQNLGIARQEVGNTDGAVRAWEEAAKRDAKNVVVRLQLGQSYIALKRPRDAVRVGREAVALAQDSAHTHAVLGDALRACGDIVAARAPFARAAQLDPKQYGHLPGLLTTEPPPPPRPVPVPEVAPAPRLVQ